MTKFILIIMLSLLIGVTAFAEENDIKQQQNDAFQAADLFSMCSAHYKVMADIILIMGDKYKSKLYSLRSNGSRLAAIYLLVNSSDNKLPLIKNMVSGMIDSYSVKFLDLYHNPKNKSYMISVNKDCEDVMPVQQNIIDNIRKNRLRTN